MNTSDLRIRFALYAPNGARIAVLPDVATHSVSRIHNGLPSLTFEYPILSPTSADIQKGREIVVEWNDGALWREDSDSRFLIIKDERNQVDPTGMVTYTCPGYGYNLSKATVVVDPLSKNPNNQKRQFVQQSVGAILRQLVSEAKGRGNLPGLSVDFDSTTDSAGEAWRFDEISPAFDRGQDYLSIIQALADDGKLDWRMDGRVLHVYNPGNALEAPRANRAAVHDTTTIDPDAYLATVSSAQIDYAEGGAASGSEGGSFASDLLAVAADGVPNYTTLLNYEFRSGLWNGQASRSLAIYRQLGQNTTDLKTRAFGSLVCETGPKVRYLLVIPDALSNAQAVAARVLDSLPGGAIITSGTSGEDWWTHADSGLHQGITSAFLHRGVPTLVLGEFTDVIKANATSTIYGVVQNGWANSRSLHSSLASQLSGVVGLAVYDSNDSYQYLDMADRADWLKARSWEQSRYASSVGTSWARVLLSTDRITTAGQQQSAATAIIAALTPTLGSGIAHIATKPSVDPETTRPPASAIHIRYNGALEATTTSSIEDAAAVVYGYGDNFSSTELNNAGANLPWGPWEAVIGQGGLEDSDTMQASLYKAIDQGAAARIEVTRRLPMINLQYMPYRDYDHGDLVRVQNGDNTFTEYQILQMVVSQQDGDPVVDLTMADLFRSREEKIARSAQAANGTVGSSARLGGVGVKPSPNSSDNRTPSAPTNLTVTASRATGADGIDRPSLALAWNAVTTATDTSAMEIDGYAISVAVNGGDLIQMAAVPGDNTSATIPMQQTDASLSIQVAVAAIGSNARTGTPALSGSVFLGADTTPPPRPSMPTATSRSGQTQINWDGTLVGTIPPDFDRVEVMVSGLMAVTDDPANYRGSLQKPGSIVLNDLPYGNTIYFALVAVDFRGNRSPISDVGSVSVQFVDANDLANGSVDETKIDPTLLGTIDSANGKNKITYSTVAPNVNGENAGDIWFQYSGSTLIGSWRWTGSAWSATQFGNGVIGTLDAGKITTGILDANRISVANLSTLSTNLGNISGGTINGVRVNGGVVYGAKIVGGDYARIQTSETFLGAAAGTSYWGPTMTFLFANSSTDGFQTWNSTTQSGYITGQQYSIRFGYSSSRYLDIDANGVNVSGGFTVNGSAVIRSGDSPSFNTVSVGGALYGSNSIYGLGLTGVANLQCSTSGNNYRIGTISSLSRFKLDQKEIPLTYSILDLTGRTWVGKFEHDLDETYDTRTPGFVAEEVEAVSTANDNILEPLLIRDENGLQALAYDRIPAYLIPVIRDMNTRLTALEAVHG